MRTENFRPGKYFNLRNCTIVKNKIQKQKLIQCNQMLHQHYDLLFDKTQTKPISATTNAGTARVQRKYSRISYATTIVYRCINKAICPSNWLIKYKMWAALNRRIQRWTHPVTFHILYKWAQRNRTKFNSFLGVFQTFDVWMNIN